jgi:hypothetical protein
MKLTMTLIVGPRGPRPGRAVFPTPVTRRLEVPDGSTERSRHHTDPVRHDLRRGCWRYEEQSQARPSQRSRVAYDKAIALAGSSAEIAS